MSPRKEVASIEVPTKRSLRSTPPVYAPSFIIYHGKNYRDQTFCIPSDRSYHVRSIPEMRGMKCTASFYGWLYLRDRFSNECHLFNPATLTKIQLPMLIDETFHTGVLTSPPTEQNCLVMFFSNKRNMCVFCRIGDTKWTTQELKCRRTNGIVITGIRKALSNNGKIYLFFREGAAVIDVQDGFACIETYAMERLKVIPAKTSIHYIESNGEIYHVCSAHLGLSAVIQKFIVLKLDLSTMVREKVERIGDRIFLLGDTNSKSISVSAAEFGGKGNCIYFFAYGRTDMYCYDMEDGTMKVTQPCPTRFSQWEISAWVVPNCKMQAKIQVAAVTEEFQVTNSILPAEIMNKIIQSLDSGGNIRFRLASKAFLPMTAPVQSLNPKKLLASQDLPLLISFASSTTNICYFYNPIYTDVYTTNFSLLRDAIVRHAKFGWLLMSFGTNCHFFFNPLTREIIQLPTGFPRFGRFVNMSFSSPPTSTDCLVFGHTLCGKNFAFMSIYRKSQNRWSNHDLMDLGYTFIPSNCNQVYQDGVFYSLSKDGKLGVFDPNKPNEEDMWKVYTNLSVPSVSLSTAPLIYRDPTRSFIVESDREILCVFVGCMGNPVHVYKLDQSKETKKWIKVESLGNRVMFLSHTTSILVPAVLKGTENRIYLPRFKKNGSVYFCLNSGKFHSFGDRDSREDWIDTSEHWNCTWFQAPPALSDSSKLGS